MNKINKQTMMEQAVGISYKRRLTIKKKKLGI